ncbi:MAG: matrixin family metalloprotease [Nitrososphaerales archaeon]
MKRTFALLIISVLISSSIFTIVPVASPTPSIELAVFYELMGTGEYPYTDKYDRWDYDGIHWYDGLYTDGIPKGGIKYYVNPSGVRISSSSVIEAVKKAFEKWDDQVTVELFNDSVETISKVSGSGYDGKNVVSWEYLRPGIVAVAYVWYYSDTLEIVEFGIVFNKYYTWGIDPDGEGPRTINAFDIQNVATHEAGHTLMLDDLYMNEAKELTMYGYTSRGETKKQSLGLGDINGIKYIYGA